MGNQISDSDKQPPKNIFKRIWQFIVDLITAISGALPF